MDKPTVEECRLLGCGAMKILCEPTFRRNVTPLSSLKMEMDAIHSSEMLVHTRSTRCHIPEDSILQNHRRENLRSYKLIVAQLVKKFPAFYGTPSVHYCVHNSPPLGPSMNNFLQLMSSHPVPLRSILLPFHQCLGNVSGLFPFTFAAKILCLFLLFPCMLNVMPMSSYVVWSP
jgi:hypothetical protein